MAKAVKKGKEVSLETVLWNCRVALRGVGSTEKNREVNYTRNSKRTLTGLMQAAYRVFFFCLHIPS